jgi:hypothetical protein
MKSLFTLTSQVKVFLGEFGTLNDKKKSTKIEIICSRFFLKIKQLQEPRTLHTSGFEPRTSYFKVSDKGCTAELYLQKVASQDCVLFIALMALDQLDCNLSGMLASVVSSYTTKLKHVYSYVKMIHLGCLFSPNFSSLFN